MLPLYLDLSDKRIIVFGGGSVAERKIGQILELSGDTKQGALTVDIYSLDFTARIEELCAARTVHCFQCDLWDQDLRALVEGAFLILICTHDETLNKHIFREVRTCDALINYSDRGDTFMSSVIKRGELIISISTGGKAPAMARYMREKISALLRDEEEKMLYVQNYLREQFKDKLSDSESRRAILTDVLNDSDCWAALAAPPDVAKERILKIIEERYA